MNSYQAMTGGITADNLTCGNGSIILDSGVSDHMFNNIEDFSKTLSKMER